MPATEEKEQESLAQSIADRREEIAPERTTRLSAYQKRPGWQPVACTSIRMRPNFVWPEKAGWMGRTRGALLRPNLNDEMKRWNKSVSFCVPSHVNLGGIGG